MLNFLQTSEYLLPCRRAYLPQSHSAGRLRSCINYFFSQQKRRDDTRTEQRAAADIVVAETPMSSHADDVIAIDLR